MNFYDNDFQNFVNYLQSNNVSNMMPNFNNPNLFQFNSAFRNNYMEPSISFYNSLQRRCNILDDKINEISKLIRDFSFNNSNYHNRKRKYDKHYRNDSRNHRRYNDNDRINEDYSYSRSRHHRSHNKDYDSNKYQKYNNRRSYNKYHYNESDSENDYPNRKKIKFLTEGHLLKFDKNKNKHIESSSDLSSPKEISQNGKNNKYDIKNHNKVSFKFDNDSGDSDNESENKERGKKKEFNKKINQMTELSDNIVTSFKRNQNNNNNNNNSNNNNNNIINNNTNSKSYDSKSSSFKQVFFYPNIKTESKKKYLIVFDIYNLFYQRIGLDSVSSLIKISPHFQFKNSYLYLRPYLDTFLKELFNLNNKINEGEGEEDNEEDNEEDSENGFEIALWNTAKPFITKDMTEFVLNNVPVDRQGNKKVNYIEKLNFLWTSDQCQYNPDAKEEEPRFERNIETIINNDDVNVCNGIVYPAVNEFNHWKKENIILVSSMNPNSFYNKSNVLYVPSYDVNNLQLEAKNDTTLLSLLQYLKILLTEQPVDVSSYLYENPLCVMKKDSYGIIKYLKVNSLESWDSENYPNKIRQTEFYVKQSTMEEMNIKYGNGRKKTNVIYKTIPTEPKNKYLIIFDLNGTLLHRLKNNSIINEKKTRMADFSMNGKFVYLRPYLDAFIEALFNIDEKGKEKFESGFAVGTWTSAMVKNSELMLSQILNVEKRSKNNKIFCQDYSNRIFFKWARDFCTPIPDTDHETEKNMDHLWQHKKNTFCRGTVYPAVNEFGHWNEKNTIIIDDSPHKAKQYPYNAIHLPTYEITNKDNDSETVLLSLIKYLKTLYKKGPNNVQKYIKKHPFSKVYFDDTIELDDTLSVQEKFDKLKESTRIRIKSKWIVSGDEIRTYATNHAKYRKSRLQVNLFNMSKIGGKENKNFNVNTMNKNNQFKKRKFFDQEVNKKDNKRKKSNNFNNNNNNNSNNNNNNNNNNNKSVNEKPFDIMKLLNPSNNLLKKNNHNNNNNNDNDDDDDDDVKIKKSTINNKNNKNIKENLTSIKDNDDDTIYEKDNDETENYIMKNNHNDDNNNYNDDNDDDDDDDDYNDDELSDNAIEEFNNKINVTLDDDTMNMLLEMQEFSNVVKSETKNKEEPKLFRRGVFY
ncbi:hypothetical protein BCR32DRAFT_296532 [Anaeromyces robustus]|uniref:FCP1 homology domain-containing protein n=1 Tax=Anaeromyces robustus TaxID=1754192 RepID=A0A1Y1WRV5_9FUNG|nr:hypothetical protein BCR32DRAFT_296532 [Anaeromyces robustus]|eukprot:ORX75998.1 hypothetical protein BCR32DRAFT_296532 [Anaeromyces robustus]